MFKNLIIIVSIVIFSKAICAQNIEITGKVIESANNIPIEYATISIIDITSKKPITGTISSQDGTFSIKVEKSDFYAEVSFIGYKTKTFREFTIERNKINLGTIVLEEDTQALDEVIVRAEVSQTEFKLDKRVFNVGQDLSSTGASVFEVLNNVPSVNVNIEGQVSLRGSRGVQILINGKPSVLATADGNALGSITADMIESIEVITNPSAKYDAEGTSGIINIIIKKEDKRGLNGSATLNVGEPKSNSFGLSVNKRTEKFNLFSQLGFGIRRFPDELKSLNQDLSQDIAIKSTGDRIFDEKFSNILLGTDYHINDHNVVTLSGSYAIENEVQDSQLNFVETDASNTTINQWIRDENTEAKNPKIRYELVYKMDFDRNEDQNLLFSALGSYFRKDQSSNFKNTTVTGNREDFQQQSRTDYVLEDYTFKLDYTHPFLNTYTLETGSQYAINSVSNDFALSDFINGDWVDNANFTNIFDFDQGVLAVYSTGAYENEKWGLKLGLRLEHTDIRTVLQNTGESNEKNYTNLFPSIHSSYNFSDAFSMQAGYSRRIRRPGLRDLNPFSNIRNNFSISTGNPDLQPEYTDALELISIHKIGKASLNLSLYNRHTVDVIEDITTFMDNVSTSQPENVGTSNTAGFEANSKYSPNNWFTVTGEFNLNYFNRKGTFEGTNFDFKGNRWTTQMTTKFKLPAQIDLEISGDYQSKFKTVQGEVAHNIFADLGIRKKLFKGRTILNLSVRDVFASRIDRTITRQPNFYLESSRQRGRFVTLGISYGFGKGEAMEFSGQRR